MPNYVGIVWTDVGFASPTNGFGDVIFEAFSGTGGTGTSLGSITGTNLGDGVFSGQRDEDRFFGAYDAAGIGSIRIRMPNSTDWEVDHLQFGFTPTPIPTPALLPGLIGMGLAAMRKKKGAEVAQES